MKEMIEGMMAKMLGVDPEKFKSGLGQVDWEAVGRAMNQAPVLFAEFSELTQGIARDTKRASAIAGQIADLVKSVKKETTTDE